MERFRIRLSGGRSRAMAIHATQNAPEGRILEIREETRSDAQNRLMWPLLDDVSKQVTWANRSLVPADWKNGFMMALERAEFVPGLVPGTVWPLGLSTSVLGVAKFSELIELIYSFGAENGVTFRTDYQNSLASIETHQRDKFAGPSKTTRGSRADGGALAGAGAASDAGASPQVSGVSR